jgi:hypothetical protein
MGTPNKEHHLQQLSQQFDDRKSDGFTEKQLENRVQSYA